MLSYISMRSINRTIALAALGLGLTAFAAPSAEAALIVQYDLDFLTTSRTSVEDKHALVTASEYTAHGEAAFSNSTISQFVRLDSTVNEVSNMDRVATIEAAVAYDMYGQFSITVEPGYWMTPDTLSVSLRNDRGNAGQSFSVYLRASQDDFETYVDLGSVTQVRTEDATVLTVQGPDAKEFDLSSLSNLAGTTTFRLYMVSDIGNNTTSSENIRIMPSIVLEGDISPIPEPGTLAFVGLSGLLMLRRRQASAGA